MMNDDPTCGEVSRHLVLNKKRKYLNGELLLLLPYSRSNGRSTYIMGSNNILLPRLQLFSGVDAECYSYMDTASQYLNGQSENQRSGVHISSDSRLL